MERICVDTEYMHEFSRALEQFERELLAVIDQVDRHTANLQPAMQECSRYKYIRARIQRSAKMIDEQIVSLHRIRKDLDTRREFVEAFDNGVPLSTFSRRITEI